MSDTNKRSGESPEKILEEILRHLRYDSELTGFDYGRLPISREKDALYQRAVASLGREPEMIGDVVAPTVRREIGLLSDDPFDPNQNMV